MKPNLDFVKDGELTATERRDLRIMLAVFRLAVVLFMAWLGMMATKYLGFEL